MSPENMDHDGNPKADGADVRSGKKTAASPLTAAGRRRKIFRRRPGRRAFTFIETLVVLAVIGLLMALVIPRVGRVSSGLMFRTTVDRFQAALQSAALRARAGGRFVRVRYDPESHSLRMEDVGTVAPALVPDDAAFNIRTETESGKPEQTRRSSLFGDVTTWTLPSQVKCTAVDSMGTGADEILFVFDPDGELSGPEVDIEIRSRKARLIPDAFTGRIFVEENP